jgi:hypothetical protein
MNFMEFLGFSRTITEFQEFGIKSNFRNFEKKERKEEF